MMFRFVVMSVMFQNVLYICTTVFQNVPHIHDVDVSSLVFQKISHIYDVSSMMFQNLPNTNDVSPLMFQNVPHIYNSSFSDV